MRHDLRFALVRNGLQVRQPVAAWLACCGVLSGVLHRLRRCQRCCNPAGTPPAARHKCLLGPPLPDPCLRLHLHLCLLSPTQLLQFPTVVAWSEAIRVEQPNEPMQGHLSLTGVPG